MKTLDIFSTIIAKMKGITWYEKQFFLKLLQTLYSIKGKINFANLARWSGWNEKTFRRNFSKKFDFLLFNQLLIDIFYPNEEFICVSDCSYIRKSGTKTFGLGKFWSGCQERALKGLEVSALCLINLNLSTHIVLSIQQTLPNMEEENRLGFYLKQLEMCVAYLLKKTKYWVVDGYYAKGQMWKKVKDLGLYAITKLRQDANLHYLYEGEQKKRGRPRVYGEKVKWKELDKTKWKKEASTEEGYQVYSQILYSSQWKCRIKVVYIETERKSKMGYTLLASNDLEIDTQKMIAYYRLRFQIEFIFRDAKQHLGLQDCQSRKQEVLDFHFNAVMLSLNLARIESLKKGQTSFSVSNLKCEYFNENWLQIIFTNLDIPPESIKNHPNYPKLIHWGKIAA
jgi:hypothetical protein